MVKQKVLLLGANGRVGRGFIEEYLKNKDYQRRYDLILGIRNKKVRIENFKTRNFSLDKLESLKKAMKGISVVVNLAANADANADFKDLLKPNLIGAHNVFEAAVKSKCKRVVFASSIHAVAGYGHGHKVKNTEIDKPTDVYGATKAFGEALCYTFSSKYNLSCLAIRIGAYTSDDKMRTVCYSRKDYGYIISQRDMGQLIHKCIIAPKKITYGILSGISNDKDKHMDLAFTRKLVGYKPQDNSYIICKKIKKNLK